jgi:hypothetical protein
MPKKQVGEARGAASARLPYIIECYASFHILAYSLVPRAVRLLPEPLRCFFTLVCPTGETHNVFSVRPNSAQQSRADEKCCMT